MTIPVVPAPVVVEAREGVFRLAAGAVVAVEDAALAPVAELFVADVAADGGPALVVGPKGRAAVTLTFGDEGLADAPAASGDRADGTFTDERCGLEVTPDGIRVWAATPEGVHRALTTLRQLVVAAAGEPIPAVRIVDGPRYAWRGLSLDISRTFHGPETIRRVLDMCSLFKVNVLHLHLTDNEGWRFEVPGWPLLTEVGARGATGDRPGGWLSPADLADLDAYAAARFVTIVPEVDMPGHSGAVLQSYPELATAAAAGVEGLGMPMANLDPDNDATWRFVDAVLDAAIALFPRAAFLHIGGDEAFGMADDAHVRFIDEAVRRVAARGRRVVGWQEIARAGVGPNDVVQYWMNPASLEQQNTEALTSMIPAEMLPMIIEHVMKAAGDVPAAVAKGSPILLSLTDVLYFDRPLASASTDPVQEGARPRLGLPFYPPATLRDFVDWEPADLLPEGARVQGVEGVVWCETVTSRGDLEMLVMPRLAASGEKGWATRRTWDDYAGRVAAQSAAWTARGWNWFRSEEIDWR